MDEEEELEDEEEELEDDEECDDDDDSDAPYCGSCGDPCKAEDHDFGIGLYEFWGAVGVDKNVQTVSACCEADVYGNKGLTRPYDPPGPDYEPDDYDPRDYDDSYIDDIADRYHGF